MGEEIVCGGENVFVGFGKGTWGIMCAGGKQIVGLWKANYGREENEL